MKHTYRISNDPVGMISECVESNSFRNASKAFVKEYGYTGVFLIDKITSNLPDDYKMLTIADNGNISLRN